MRTTLYTFVTVLALLTLAAGMNLVGKTTAEASPITTLQESSETEAETEAEAETETVTEESASGGSQMAAGAITGEIISVDAEAGTVTIQHTFRISDTTQLEFADPLQALIAEDGRRVTIQFTPEGDTPTATHIRLESDEDE